MIHCGAWAHLRWGASIGAGWDADPRFMGWRLGDLTVKTRARSGPTPLRYGGYKDRRDQRSFGTNALCAQCL